ncbi:MAG: G5 domain-containing protein [Clostridia bacterium]|nr:G5 domain-containing protein [Clostridia bacterium]
MKTKEKQSKKTAIILVIIIITISFAAISKKISYATNKEEIEYREKIKISQKEKIDLQEIINKNYQKTEKENIKTETVDLEYITIYKENPNLLKGVVQTIQEGRTGTEQIITKVTYENGNPKEELVSRTITKAAFDKIVEVGTAQKVEVQNKTNNNLSFDIKLNKPSGLTLEQFKKILTDDKDKNKIFEKNAEFFYYIEKQYNINGVFVAAVAIHESSWGTSSLAKNKKNLFGYGASDSDPYNNAYKFTSYSESIDLMARVFVKYYINPKGTKIYGDEKASGKYYNGSTISDVNKKYATDNAWTSGVYKNMKYLYNKL